MCPVPDKLENVERERVSGPGLARFEAAVSARYGNEITFTQFVSRWQGLDGMPLALPKLVAPQRRHAPGKCAFRVVVRAAGLIA